MPRTRAAASRPIRLFVSDLDGTLLSFSGEPSGSHRFAERWGRIPQDQRPVLCYNSGRLVQDLKLAADEAGLPRADYLLGGVGTTLVGPGGGILREYQEQFRPGWDRSLVVEVMASIPGIQRQAERYQSPFKSSWFLHDASDDQLAGIRHRLAQVELDVAVIYSSQRDLDVLPARADKGNAVRWLIDHLGIEASEVVVAGDTGNDASMFRVPGVRGILPSNARSELAAATAGCEVVSVASPEADGVIEGLDRLGLPGG